MGKVFQYGTVNTNQLLAPGVYVQILPPQQTLINGVPTNILGIVGGATWGPVNSPTIVGGIQDYIQQFGLPQNLKYDMGTAVAVAALNFANNFRCVRVTDGTDAAASKAILTTTPDTGFTATAFYTGALGNQITVTITAGSAASSYRVIVSRPNIVPEIFDNITGSGNALWINICNAINLGQSGVRGPSQLIVATVGSSTATPALSTYTLIGGLSGNSTITSSILIGADTSPGTGMYALRNSQASVVMLADCDDSTKWITQCAYGLSEGSYMIMVGPAGQTPATAATAKATAGIDCYDAKLLVGDWVYWSDTYNNVTRLVSPQGFVAGRLVNLSPERSSLNQGIFGVVSTQKSQANQIYTSADIIVMVQAGLDVIANPSPGGNYFSTQTGLNTSSNVLTNDDGYTRLTNYLAYSIASALGSFVGLLQTPSVRLSAKNAIQGFLQNLADEQMIGDVNGGLPFSVVLDATNNPSDRVALGFMQADVKVVDFRTIRVFLINLQNGDVSLASTTPN